MKKGAGARRLPSQHNDNERGHVSRLKAASLVMSTWNWCICDPYASCGPANSASSLLSPSTTIEIAVPPAPARAVRPMRWR